MNEKRALAGFAPVAGGDRLVLRRGERRLDAAPARAGDAGEA